ncbi:adenylate/guanylate cyclase domain-containing protein [Aureimonas psammosilenae]|uniref:adenylate/guanylate cyclase domain-containing protein n=1 Tax=Aureimonas psammosilenae TaxID=2495496 RepID=UPI001F16DA8D|nr:adenylate/guanylate cyclase domain-containing protein [Aureimonas psammosilenae]
MRFLNLHYRAVHRILRRCEAVLVDFHNQRLHSVVTKPYGSKAMRLRRAVAIAQLVIDVLSRTGEDSDHPAARVRVGIDSGLALAVSNGRRGHREPLFLGEPANHAAKRSGGGKGTGIYLTHNARGALAYPKVADPDSAPLTADEIERCREAAGLGVSADDIVREWRADLEANPIGGFEFSGHTPPFGNLDFETLSARNSRRQDAASVYADIDGFTDYVSRSVVSDTAAKHVVRALHVLRSELDAVLHADFGGRKVRFVGDCVHGLLAEGTARSTDAEETVTNMTLCAAAMRSSFELALGKLAAVGTDATSLGLAIGFEYGPITATRLGMKGDLVRCSVSRGVLGSEAEQRRCGGDETAIGQRAYKAAANPVRELFGTSRKLSGLRYDPAAPALAGKGDRVAKASVALASGLLKPAAAAADPFTFRNRPAGPAKRDGFA